MVSRTLPIFQINKNLAGEVDVILNDIPSQRNYHNNFMLIRKLENLQGKSHMYPTSPII